MRRIWWARNKHIFVISLAVAATATTGSREAAAASKGYLLAVEDRYACSLAELEAGCAQAPAVRFIRVVQPVCTIEAACV